MSRLAEGVPEGFPRLGEHSDDVLREELGLTADEIATLRTQGTIR